MESGSSMLRLYGVNGELTKTESNTTIYPVSVRRSAPIAREKALLVRSLKDKDEDIRRLSGELESIRLFAAPLTFKVIAMCALLHDLSSEDPEASVTIPVIPEPLKDDINANLVVLLHFLCGCIDHQLSSTKRDLSRRAAVPITSPFAERLAQKVSADTVVMESLEVD
jgi:hypothetical protein